MRKFLLYSSALMVSGLLSGAAEAACIQTPTCSSLGYSSTTACEGGLKCPFGEAWFCNVGGNGSNNDDSNTNNSGCQVGDILYSDKSCSSNVISSKTPIAVIFDTRNRLAVALKTAKKAWAEGEQGTSFDIPELSNFMSPSSAIVDWFGKNNTRYGIAECQTKGINCPAFEYVNSYKTEGTQAGDWYLPALGELNAVYASKGILDATLGKIGGEKFSEDWQWSSTEGTKVDTWSLSFANGNPSLIYKVNSNNSFYVRPILAF